MGLAIAPSSTKSCSPRICLGSWLNSFADRFSPHPQSLLSQHLRITQTLQATRAASTPWEDSQLGVCVRCAPSSSSLEEEPKPRLGVVILHTPMEPREGGQGASCGF